VLRRTEAISKIAEIALNCMVNSVFSECFDLRGLQKITRADGEPLQAYKLGILLELELLRFNLHLSSQSEQLKQLNVGNN